MCVRKAGFLRDKVGSMDVVITHYGPDEPI